MKLYVEPDESGNWIPDALCEAAAAGLGTWHSVVAEPLAANLFSVQFTRPAPAPYGGDELSRRVVVEVVPGP